jgi:hypothetical protein
LPLKIGEGGIFEYLAGEDFYQRIGAGLCVTHVGQIPSLFVWMKIT